MSALRYKDEEERLFKVGVYLRLSQEDKIKKEAESNSIENQRKIIKNYIDNSDELVLINEYVDDGYTGTNFDRPSFQELLNDIKNKRIDTIIVKDLSRFGRNYIEVGKFLEETFPTLRVRFISIIDKIDSFKDSESSSSMLVNFKNLLNDEYCRDISKKTRAALNTRKKKGDYVAGIVPFGYKRDSENSYHLVIDEEPAKIIKLIFELAKDGKGTLEISNYLNDRSIPTSLQYKKELGLKCGHQNISYEDVDNLKWSPTAVATILRNEVYLGHTVQNKYSHISYKIHRCQKNQKEKWTKVENTHEPLVSEEDFNYINERLFTKIIRVRKNYERALFSGFLICNDCERGFHYIKSKVLKDGSRNSYYMCGSNNINKDNCSSHIIHEDKLKQLVIKAINKQIKLVTKLNNEINIISNNKKTSIKVDVLNSRKESILDNIDKKMKLKQELYTDWKENIISFDDYKEYTKSYSDEIENERKVLSIIDEELNEISNIPNYHKDLIETFNNKDLITNLTRDILFDFIDHIIIYENNKIEIIFKYSDIYKNLSKYVKENNDFLIRNDKNVDSKG